MKIVIASHNKGKLKEFKSILNGLDVTIVTAFEEGVNLDSFEEVGLTYEENAFLKAHYVYEKTGCLSIADDSGIEILALPDILGVYSARFMGADTSYDIKNACILEMLEGKDRSAIFTSAIALVGPNTKEMFMGKVEGQIAQSTEGDQGFGYDPIFIPNGYHETYATMDASIKNQMSHRALALKQFVAYLRGLNL